MEWHRNIIWLAESIFLSTDEQNVISFCDGLRNVHIKEECNFVTGRNCDNRIYTKEPDSEGGCRTVVFFESSNKQFILWLAGTFKVFYSQITKLWQIYYIFLSQLSQIHSQVIESFTIIVSRVVLMSPTSEIKHAQGSQPWIKHVHSNGNRLL